MLCICFSGMQYKSASVDKSVGCRLGSRQKKEDSFITSTPLKKRRRIEMDFDDEIEEADVLDSTYAPSESNTTDNNLNK